MLCWAYPTSYSRPNHLGSPGPSRPRPLKTQVVCEARRGDTKLRVTSRSTPCASPPWKADSLEERRRIHTDVRPIRSLRGRRRPKCLAQIGQCWPTLGRISAPGPKPFDICRAAVLCTVPKGSNIPYPSALWGLGGQLRRSPKSPGVTFEHVFRNFRVIVIICAARLVAQPSKSEVC